MQAGLFIVLNVHKTRRAQLLSCRRVSATANLWLLPAMHMARSAGCSPKERLLGFLLGLYLMHESVVITIHQIILLLMCLCYADLAFSGED